MDLTQPRSADVFPVWESYLSPAWFPTVMIADELGILAELDRSPTTLEGLAAATSLNERALGAVLPMLASLGFLVPREGRYHVTDVASSYLVEGGDYYWGGVFAGHRRNNSLVDGLRRALTIPDPPDALPAELHAGGNSDAWAAGSISAEAAESSAAYMYSHSAQAAAALATTGLFAGTKRLLDVGAGSGVFAIALAQRHRELQATLLDLDAVCDVAMSYVQRADVADRIDTCTIDMFRTDWPTGYDAHFLSNIFHDWRPATCAELARRSFASLEPGGSINLHEMLIDDDGSGPRIAASFAVLMVAGTQGQQYSFSQLRKILAEAGFVDIELARATSTHSIVRGYKPTS